MANTLGITEVTLLQVADATHATNTLAGLRGGDPLQSVVIRLAGHIDDTAAEVGTDTDRMALFESKAFGHPWVKYAGSGADVVHRGAATPVSVPTNCTRIYPNFQYVQTVTDGVGQADGIFDGTSQQYITYLSQVVWAGMVCVLSNIHRVLPYNFNTKYQYKICTHRYRPRGTRAVKPPLYIRDKPFSKYKYSL